MDREDKNQAGGPEDLTGSTTQGTLDGGSPKPPATVTSLVAHKSKKQARKKEGPSRDELYSEFRAALSHKTYMWPKMPEHFEVLCDPRGVRSFVQIFPGDIVRYVAEDAVAHALMAYSERLTEFKISTLEPAVAKKIIAQWASIKKPFDLDAVTPVRMLSEEGYCFHRLPFDPEETETPLFDELLSRVHNAEALLAWIGSLFDPKSSRQQYVWMYGEGLNGKGSLIELLRRLFGPSFSAQQPPERGDRFWTSGLLGMRIVALPDCNDGKFITSGLFKSITGGDAIKTEGKGEKAVTSMLHCKLIFGSNEQPQLSRLKADMRRIIYCEFDPLPDGTKPDQLYGERLWAEAPGIVGKARATYKRVNEGTWIPSDQERVGEVIEDAEERWQVLFQKYFEIKPDGELEPAKLQAILQNAQGLTPWEQGEFKRFMKQRHGVRNIRKEHADGRRERVYRGLIIRPDVLENFDAILDDDRF